MPHSGGAAQQVNLETQAVASSRKGEVHAAMARIADNIVESGDDLSLESLIKAFWRTYSTPEGNIVSIHEGRVGPPAPVVAEDAFARLAGRMDQIAQSLGSLSDKVDSEEPRPKQTHAEAMQAYRSEPVSTDDEAGPASEEPLVRRRRDEDPDKADAPKIETSLPDRSQFEVALRENYRIAQSEIEPLSVAICSVSRIDKIVEQHGLHTATRLMERVASTLSLATKGECYSARKSASEFIMLARGITITQFRDILEQSIFDLSVRRWHDKFSNKTLGMVEMHVGVAHVFDFPSPSHAMRAADLAHERAMLEHSSTVVLADKSDPLD